MTANVSKTKKILFILSCVTAVICAGIFLFIAIKYSVDGGFSVDGKLIEFSQDIQNKNLTEFFKILTHLGSFITVIILTAILAIVLKPILLKIFVVCNVGAVGAFCLVVKKIVKRPRPVGINLIAETGFSFPSAHSMISVVFYGFIIFLIWKLIKNKTLNIISTSVISILALTICYTRVYLGVHFITDVLAGALAGVAYLLVAIWAYVIIEKFIKLKKQNTPEHKEEV